MPKTIHGIETCPKCLKIFTVLVVNNAFNKEKGIRFVLFCKLANAIDPTIGAPTAFRRHLAYLIKKGIVKRTRKGPKNVSYSLADSSDSPLISKEDLELSKKWLDFHSEMFSSWTLNRIITNILELSELLELETIKLCLEKLLPGKNLEDSVLRSKLKEAFYKQFGDLLTSSLKGRSSLEYKEAIESLEKSIRDAKKELFEIRKY